MVKKKIIPVVLLLAMLINIFPGVSLAAESTIADLSSLNVIHDIGLPASGVYSRSGCYSMEWSGADIYNNVVIPITKHDFSEKKYLEMWVYSEAKTGSKFTLGLISDSADTVCKDYYYTTLAVNWTGWKLISLQCDDEELFKNVYSPKGLESIDEIRLWPTYGGNTPVSGTKLYFDKITISSEQSPEAAGGSSAGNADYILADFSLADNVLGFGFDSSSEVTKSGDVTLKWSGAKLTKDLNIPDIPADWSGYKTLALDIYSESANGSSIKVAIISENPETTGSDYYMTDMIIDWTGWKRKTFKIGEGGTFSKTRTPLGWDQVTQFVFWPTYGGTQPDPDTVLYIDKIFLSESEIKEEADNSTEFILDSATVEGGIDAVAKIKELHPNNAHPRLLFNADDLANMKELITTDPFMKKTWQNVKATADAALEADVLTYGTPDGKRLPRTAPDMMPPLSLAYLMTGEEKYKERLWAEIEAVSSFPDWNPSHFLDVGDFARGMAYAYDWLYDYWTPEQRLTMRNALMCNGFKPSINHLRKGTSFAGQENNWNQVINAGIGLAALTIGDEPGYEGIANEIINWTAKRLPLALETFDPDGASLEGPSYWAYANECFFQYDSSMFISMNYDFGLSDFVGMQQTGYFPIMLLGPTNQTFNFSDCGSGLVGNGVLFYLARRYDHPEFGGYEISIKPTGGNWCDMALYRPDERQADYSKDLPLDKRFEGEQELATFRSSWSDSNAMFVGFKGGYNQASHCDLDLGTFVMDAVGTRWFIDLGSEYYEAPGMWDFGPNDGRWKYYRKNTEGHNTLVINPCDKTAQNVYAHAKFDKYETSDPAAYAVINLTEAYQDYAEEVKRGIGLINNRSSVIVQDEIKTKSPSEIYSFFHTKAEIELAEDKRSAVLTMGNKKLKAELISDGGEFSVMDAVPLPTSAQLPAGGVNLANSDVRKLAVHMTNAVDPTISVIFTPIADSVSEITKPETIPLSQWDAYKEGGASLSSISVDGISLNGFSAYNTMYRIDTGIVGEVTAEGNQDSEITIIQAESKNETAYVVAKSKSTGMQTVYSVSFDERIPAMFTEEIQSYDIVGIRASSVPESQNIPEHTLDKDYSTRWAAEGDGEWIEWDLGSVVPIDTVSLAFLNGDSRIAKFSIEISDDAQTWTEVYNGMSSGTTNNMESYTFNQTNARYVRMKSFGNTTNKWVSLAEVNIPKVIPDFDDTNDHWAREDISLFSSLGLVKGVSDTEFAPNANISRAEFTAIAVRALGLEGTSASVTKLSDVSDDDWYAQVIATAMEYGLIPELMYSDGSFRPNDLITREEMTAIIVRAYESTMISNIPDAPIEIFTDCGSITDEYVPYVKKGLALRLVKGAGDGLFAPKMNATRAEAVVMIKRLLTQVKE